MEWNRMPMGYKNAHGIIQCMLDELRGELSGKGVEVYLDDAVIHTRTKGEMKKLAWKVLKRFDENNIIVETKRLQLKRKGSEITRNKGEWNNTETNRKVKGRLSDVSRAHRY